MNEAIKLAKLQKLYDVLKRISKYETVDRLRKNAERDYGLSGDEAIEMAYENILFEASNAIAGMRETTMNNAIKLAIEKGGYNTAFLDHHVATSDTEIIATLDPNFWQSLGKALGWREGMYLKWYRDRQGGVDESLDLEYEENIAPDVYHALRYHEINLTGGDTSKFWKDLLN